MIAPRLRGRAQAQVSDGQKQERHADELQKQRPGLLHAAAAHRHRRLIGRHPKAQGGDDQLAARAVEQIERHRYGENGAEHGEELEEGEVQKIHEAPSLDGRFRNKRENGFPAETQRRRDKRRGTQENPEEKQNKLEAGTRIRLSPGTRADEDGPRLTISRLFFSAPISASLRLRGELHLSVE